MIDVCNWSVFVFFEILLLFFGICLKINHAELFHRICFPDYSSFNDDLLYQKSIFILQLFDFRFKVNERQTKSHKYKMPFLSYVLVFIRIFLSFVLFFKFHCDFLHNSLHCDQRTNIWSLDWPRHTQFIEWSMKTAQQFQTFRTLSYYDLNGMSWVSWIKQTKTIPTTHLNRF